MRSCQVSDHQSRTLGCLGLSRRENVVGSMVQEQSYGPPPVLPVGRP